MTQRPARIPARCLARRGAARAVAAGRFPAPARPRSVSTRRMAEMPGDDSRVSRDARRVGLSSAPASTHARSRQPLQTAEARTKSRKSRARATYLRVGPTACARFSAAFASRTRFDRARGAAGCAALKSAFADISRSRTKTHRELQLPCSRRRKPCEKRRSHPSGDIFGARCLRSNVTHAT